MRVGSRRAASRSPARRTLAAASLAVHGVRHYSQRPPAGTSAAQRISQPGMAVGGGAVQHALHAALDGVDQERPQRRRAR